MSRGAERRRSRCTRTPRSPCGGNAREGRSPLDSGDAHKKPAHHLVRVPERVALPDREAAESKAAQGASHATVTRDIPGELPLPQGSIVDRDCGSRASPMPVPEAAVHEDDPAALAVGEVGLAGQVAVPDAESHAYAVEG